MSARHLVPLLVPFLALAPALAQGPAARATAAPPAETRDERLVERFFQDGAHAEDQAWYELDLRYLDLDNGSAWGFGLTGAVAPLPGLELGARIGLLDLDLDRGFGSGPDRDETGLTDLEVAAKFRFSTGVSAGVDLTFPTGDEEDGFGSGETDASLFLALRSPLPRHVRDGGAGAPWGEVTGHLGFRFNDDARILDENLEGKVSFQAGAGLFRELQPDLVLILEALLESERYEETDWIGALVAGVSWQVADNVALRPSLTVGVSDEAPDWVARVGFVFRP